jgi:probable HAF family extracellular repeat protein
MVLPSASSQIVGALNNRGQFVGGAATTGSRHRAFVASAARFEEIAVYPGSDYSAARGINDDGEVVGVANSADVVAAFRWTPQGGAQRLRALPTDTTSEAFRINRYGQVVGYSSGAGGIRAVLWSRDGAVQELAGLPEGKYSRALGINSRGDVVGSVGRAPETRAFLWTTSGAKDLGTLPGDGESEALSLNDAGDIVGWSGGAAGTRAVMWSSGEMRDLGGLAGAEHSRARAVNARGEVVGDSGNAHRSRAFLWTRARGMQDLNRLLPARSRFVLVEAVAINDQGHIVALGREHDQHDGESRYARADPLRVFLLVPGWRARIRHSAESAGRPDYPAPFTDDTVVCRSSSP